MPLDLFVARSLIAATHPGNWQLLGQTLRIAFNSNRALGRLARRPTDNSGCSRVWGQLCRCIVWCKKMSTQCIAQYRKPHSVQLCQYKKNGKRHKVRISVLVKFQQFRRSSVRLPVVKLDDGQTAAQRRAVAVIRKCSAFRRKTEQILQGFVVKSLKAFFFKQKKLLLKLPP